MSTPAQSTRQTAEVLVAEDSPTQARRLQHILEQQGYHVTVTANGREALEAARQRKPAIIISDVVMPEMDGYELCRRVKAEAGLGDVPVILVTTLSDPQDVIRGLESCADNFILKPYDEHYLLSRLQFVLINREMRQVERVGMGVEIFFNGQKHFITADRMQILNLLLSTYEAAIQRNKELKHSQEELRSLNAQLEGANKELESFSYSVSHDLRAPLRAIDGFSRILEEDHSERLDGESRRLLKVIRDNTRRMGELIDDLLEFSRVGRKPAASARIDMKRLVEETLGEVGAAAGRRAEVTVGPLPPGYADATLIRQVWINLLSNAMKFSGKRERPVVEVTGYEDAEYNVYCVKDNGAGFDMRYYDKLFGVFQRLHDAEEFPGTGVGLAIVQRAVAKHGGRAWAEGKVNAGAAFYFTLPKREGM
ncbi:MAG: response regulator [Betaproteobacteria bacterium]|nr:response regulator [Betaproteobacteria bacterium]